jgi:ribonuclease HII
MSELTLEDLRRQVLAGPPYHRALLTALRRDPRVGGRLLYQTCMARQRAETAEQRRLETMLTFEREVQVQGFACVAGVDEAGRGPLAGPIVAGAVVLAGVVPGLNDSKQLGADHRAALFDILRSGAHDIGVGVVSAETIDQIGIQSANYRAMAEAVAGLKSPPDFLLVDGFNLPGVTQPQMRLIKGDARSLSIAAASIIAKVTRDRMLDALDRQYPEYGFAAHKGYATREHLEALARYGPCVEHRRSFAPIARTPETGRLFE